MNKKRIDNYTILLMTIIFLLGYIWGLIVALNFVALNFLGLIK